MWLLQLLAMLEHKKFRATLVRIEKSFEPDSMAAQIAKLALNVHKKHTAVNVGFALAGGTLLLFSAASVSHVMELLARD